MLSLLILTAWLPTNVLPRRGVWPSTSIPSSASPATTPPTCKYTLAGWAGGFLQHQSWRSESHYTILSRCLTEGKMYFGVSSPA
jgi:hypothetical protein